MKSNFIDSNLEVQGTVFREEEKINVLISAPCFSLLISAPFSCVNFCIFVVANTGSSGPDQGAGSRPSATHDYYLRSRARARDMCMPLICNLYSYTWKYRTLLAKKIPGPRLH